jgi:hypothetical protein
MSARTAGLVTNEASDEGAGEGGGLEAGCDMNPDESRESGKSD